VAVTLRHKEPASAPESYESTASEFESGFSSVWSVQGQFCLRNSDKLPKKHLGKIKYFGQKSQEDDSGFLPTIKNMRFSTLQHRRLCVCF
jgi:hypothetical protein